MGFKDIKYSQPQHFKSYEIIVFYIEQWIVIFSNPINLSYINPDRYDGVLPGTELWQLDIAK